jgi:hypothetical protein
VVNEILAIKGWRDTKFFEISAFLGTFFQKKAYSKNFFTEMFIKGTARVTDPWSELFKKKIFFWFS